MVRATSERLLRRLVFPFRQLWRDHRSPDRERWAANRAGQDLSPLRPFYVRNPLALACLLFGTPNPKGAIWGVCVAKNEERRIGGSVRRLFADGVDAVVVADNGSTDGTRDVLADLAREGPVHVLDDTQTAFYEVEKRSNLVRAATRCGASWIVPFDADELWYATEGTIASTLRNMDGNVARAPMHNFAPRPDQLYVDDIYVEQTMRRNLPPLAHKVAFRSCLLATLAAGSHAVTLPVVDDVDGLLMIRHYPFVDFDHFVDKLHRGRDAVSAAGETEKNSHYWLEFGSMTRDELVAVWEENVSGVPAVHDPLPPGTWR